MDTVHLVTSEYNDACNCHPEYIKRYIGVFPTNEAAVEYCKKAPQTITVRGTIVKNISYDIEELPFFEE